MRMSKPTKPANSQTLLRGLSVLECVAHMPRSIPEIAEEAGISYQTAHRIVSVLTDVRYLRQVDSRLYGLGCHQDRKALSYKTGAGDLRHSASRQIRGW
mgnify:CR=1 FL=1